MSSQSVNASSSQDASQSRGIRAIVLSMAGRVVIIAINAATGIITARSLHPAGRGEQAAIMLWPVLLANAMTLGLPSALIYYIRKQRESVAQFAGVALALAFVIGLVGALIAVLLMPTLLARYPSGVILNARYLLFTIPIGMVGLVARTVLEAEGEFSASIKAQWLSPGLTLIALVTLWATHLMTPVTSAMAYTLTVIPTSLWLLLRLRQTTAIAFDQKLSAARLLLSYGLRSYGIDLCSTLASYVDQALVVSILSPKDMGIYVVALGVSRMLNFCQASVIMVLLPKMAGLASPEVMQLTGRAARFSSLATAMCATCLYVLSPVAIRMLYGSSFRGAIPVLRVLLVEVTVAGTVMVLAQAPMALGRPGITTILQAAGLGLTIPLMLFYVPRYGIVGAAIALLASTTIRLFLILAAFPLILKLPTPRLWFNHNDLLEMYRLSKMMMARTFSAFPNEQAR